MYQHALLIHSNHSIGKRIALHKLCEGIADIEKFMSLNSKLRDRFGHLTFSLHHVQTASKSTNSIAEYDGFFNGMKFYSDIDEFIGLIEDDIKIKPIDVAKIILSKGSYSHLEIQKLVYFVYEEYFKMYGDDIFSDNFEAWELGPVIPDMYHSLKKYGKSKIKKYESTNVFPGTYSRLIKIPRYDKLIKAIDKTLEKYNEFDAKELVDETHIPGGPWDRVYQNGIGQNQIIPKDLIKSCI